MKDNRTYLEIKDFPKDAVVTFGDIETESYFDDKNTTVHYPDTLCPLCEMEKSTIGYDAKHTAPEIGNGVRIKSLCEAEQACKPLFEETGLITGEGLTTDVSLMYHNPTPSAMVQFVPNNNFEIYGEDGDMLVRIDMSSGDLEYGDNYNPNDACRVFWDCLSAFKRPDHWEETDTYDASKVLRQVRRILEVPEAESIIEVARQRMGLTHEDHCNWHNWDHSYSWSASDCTCEKLISAPPGIADDMPAEYNIYNSHVEFKFPFKKIEPSSFKTFDDAMKVIK